MVIVTIHNQMAIYLLNKCGLCEICKILMSSFCHLLPPHIFIHLLFLLKSWKGVKMVNPISRLPSRRRLWLSSPASEHQPAASNSSSSNYFSSSSSSPPPPTSTPPPPACAATAVEFPQGLSQQLCWLLFPGWGKPCF